MSQILFALGALVTAAGVGLLGYRSTEAGPSFPLYAAAAVMMAGALLWSWHVYQRAATPALFTTGQLPAWPFVVYSLLTMVGLTLLGMAILQTGLASWVGWLCIGSAALFLVLALVFRDMPPFVYYLITLTVAVAAFRAAATGAG